MGGHRHVRVRRRDADRDGQQNADRVSKARTEIAHAASLSDHPAGTLLAIEREMHDDGISERIRIVPRSDDDGGHATIWSFEEEPDDQS